MNRPRLGFRVHFHNIAAEGDVVLTERTDELAFGPVVARIWVWGRFELRDGRIAVWRDSFDWLDSTIGLARGVAALASPSLNRPWPG
jgi:limonene-1,2-epoxide hydrolase